MTIGSDAGRACFDDAPVAMFVEDIGGVRRRLEELRAAVGDDLTAHLAAHPEEAARLASLVRIVDANREAVRFFEATSKADLERALPPYFDERALAVFAEAVAAVARGVTRYDCELPLRTARGGTKLVAVSLSIGLGGSPDALVISFVDVTERLRMEAEIRDALRFNQLILDTAPLGVITFKASGECVAANQTAAAIIGGTVPQLLEQNFRRLESWRRDGLLAAAEEALATGTVVTREFQAQTSFGKQGSMLARLTPFPARGEPHLLVIVEDTTERRRAEAERRDLQAQLFESQKMEAIGTLAGGVAHDFNNLLGGMMGIAGMMRVKGGPEFPFRDELRELEACCQSAAELTRQLLGFARRGQYELRPLHLGTLIDETARMYGRTRKDLTIEREHHEDLLTVAADRSQMEQVLLNLYVNAGEAMPHGGRLRLCARNATLEPAEAAALGLPPGRVVRVTVSDTGSGMDEATRARIFEPFFTTKPTGHGTGLGLASAYAIVKNHGGAITVESAPGAGSTFTVHLPAREAPPAAEPRRARTVRRGRETILVVDDEAVVLKAYGRLLRKLGYQVLTATDGEEALAVYREHGAAIALVLLDMVMPGQGGGATLDALKAHDPQVKVLLCSGYGLDGEAEEILARGCAGFIQKPFSPEALSGKLRELLGRGTGG